MSNFNINNIPSLPSPSSPPILTHNESKPPILTHLPSLLTILTETYSLSLLQLRTKYYLLSRLFSTAPDEYTPQIDVNVMAEELHVTVRNAYRYVAELREKEPWLFEPDLLGDISLIKQKHSGSVGGGSKDSKDNKSRSIRSKDSKDTKNRSVSSK